MKLDSDLDRNHKYRELKKNIKNIYPPKHNLASQKHLQNANANLLHVFPTLPTWR